MTALEEILVNSIVLPKIDPELDRIFNKMVEQFGKDKVPTIKIEHWNSEIVVKEFFEKFIENVIGIPKSLRGLSVYLSETDQECHGSNYSLIWEGPYLRSEREIINGLSKPEILDRLYDLAEYKKHYKEYKEKANSMFSSYFPIIMEDL